MYVPSVLVGTLGIKTIAPELARGLVDQDRGADLDDQPARTLERCHAASFLGSRCFSTSFSSSCSNGWTPCPETPEITYTDLRLALASSARLASMSSAVMASTLLSAKSSFLRTRLPP